MSLLSWSGRVALAIAVTATTAAHAEVNASVAGVVEDALMHPLPNAVVVLHGPSGETVAKTVTSADGKFQFANIPIGDYTVEASSPGLVEDHQHLQLTSGAAAQVELVLVNSEEVIQISEDWAVPAPPTASGSVETVTRAELAALPGGDDRPVTDVIATQPGFVVDALGSVYARGNHGDIQYQIDGIPIPDSVGSLFAASIPVRLIQTLEILSGGMPAEYGDRLSAVVNLVTRQGGEHDDGNVQLRYGSYQTTEVGAAYSTTEGKLGAFVGGSYLYSQRALDPPSIDPILHDTGTTGRIFTRLDWAPCECNRYELFATYAHNRFQIPLDPSATPFDPAVPRPVDQFGNDAPAFVPRKTNATETEDELFAAFSYTHKLSDTSSFQLAPLYKLSRGVLYGDAPHALAADADPGATTSDVTRVAHHAGGVAAYSDTEGHHQLKLGLQTDFLYGTTRFTSYVRDDAGGGIDQGMTAIGSDRTIALTSGAYAQDKWTAGKLVLDVGLRFDHVHVALDGGQSHDDVGVSPRLGASYAFTKNVVGHAFTGVLWQPPSPTDAGNAARALGIATDTVTYDLKPETDLYAETGVTARLASPLRAGLVAYGRYAYDQLDDTAIGSTSLLSNYNFSRGRAAGLEANVDVRAGAWLSGFANASLGLAEGKGIASAKFLFDAATLANDTWQTLDHAQLLTANAGATIRDGRFEISGLASYGSGLRTGADNASHVPGHVRADATLAYTFVPHAYPIRVGVDVINLFDAHYAFRIANGFVGSSYAPARSVYLSLSIPLAAEPHHKGE